MEILKTCLEEISLSGLEGELRSCNAFAFDSRASISNCSAPQGPPHVLTVHVVVLVVIFFYVYLYRNCTYFAGCTLEELWEHLSQRKPPITFKLDQFIKPLAWKQMLTYAGQTSALQLYKLPQPRELQQTLSHFSLGVSFKWTEYKHPFQYHPVNDSTKGARGSCGDYFEREDVTSEIADQQLDLASVAERYGNVWKERERRGGEGRGRERERETDRQTTGRVSVREERKCVSIFIVHYAILHCVVSLCCSYGNSLVLVTSQELRDRALTPPTQPPPTEISDITYGILEVAGCARHHGISRPDMTSKYLKIDARSCYHYCKVLRQQGLLAIKVR